MPSIVVISSFFPTLVFTRYTGTVLNVEHLEMQHWTLTSELSSSSSSCRAINPVLPIEAVNFPTFTVKCYGESLIDLVNSELPIQYISFVGRTPLAAHEDTPLFTGSHSSLPKVSCFLTSTVNCFLTLHSLSLTTGPKPWGVARPIGLCGVFSHFILHLGKNWEK